MRLLIVLAAAAAACAALPAVAAAHAALESSKPAADSSVPVSPRSIVLTFTEAPDVSLSLIKVLDANAAAVPGISAPERVPGDDRSLQVTVSKPLADGVYTVNWRAVSSVDGHVLSGAFAFGVGRQPPPGSAQVVDLLQPSASAQALADVGRWLLYVALSVAIGAAATSLFVFGGVLPHGGARVLYWTVVAALVALACVIWAEKTLVGAPSLLPLFLTREGRFLLALAVALGLSLGACVLVDLWPARWSLWVLGAAGAAGVLVHVSAGHAASAAWFWLLDIVLQWVHMTGVGVWIGGLLWLLIGLRRLTPGRHSRAVDAYSRVATITLVVVLATGIARALAEVPTPSALVDESYGRVLLVKLTLVLCLVGLGALNHFRWVPALRSDATETRATRRFTLNSRGELAAAFVVFAATAVLSGLAPVVIAASSAASPAVSTSAADYATTMRVELTLAPGVAGRNSYTVWVDDYDTGDPLRTITAVRLDCSLPTRPAMAPVTTKLRRAADGSWRGGGLDFSVAGRWRVDVVVQQESTGTTVPLDILVSPAASSPSP